MPARQAVRQESLKESIIVPHSSSFFRMVSNFNDDDELMLNVLRCHETY